MARLVTKFKFIKPGDRKNIGGYAKYIATREGADKIDDSQKHQPVTQKQKDFIQKLLRDFPDAKDSLEYEDYTAKQTIGSASEFITRTVEENTDRNMDNKTYADYIATRPRAHRFGSHGLFTDDGVAVNLKKVSEELGQHDGNVWTAIVSLRREDAARLGFDKGERWRDMLRTQTEAFATNLNIPMQNLRWFAAFHNESHHPHVHMIVYSTEHGEGYLSKKGVSNLRSSLAKDIFAQDLLCIYEHQTEQRDALKVQSREIIAGIVEQINSGVYDNPIVENLLLSLADRLSKTSGKKVYGYLKADVKSIVDSIVEELAKDKRIAALYDLWYQKREEILRTYTEDVPSRLPLLENKEFKSVRNMVISEAMNIVSDRQVIEDAPETDTSEPDIKLYYRLGRMNLNGTGTTVNPEQAKFYFEKSAECGNADALYGLGKLYLNKDFSEYNVQTAVKYLETAAQKGHAFAEYTLGRLFYNGEQVPQHLPYAVAMLEKAVAQENEPAEYLLGKILLRPDHEFTDTARAERLLTKAAEAGNEYAAYTLGKAYLDGILLPMNIQKAITLLTQAADKDFAPALYTLGKLFYRGDVITQDIPRAVALLEKAVEQGNPYAAYLAGKIRLTEDLVKNADKAIRHFLFAAENGNDYAEYQLGKMFLYGRDMERDYDRAISYLTAAAGHGNQYAAQLLHSIRSNRNFTAALGSLRLLGDLSRLIQQRIDDDRNDKNGAIIDRKIRRQTEEKKQAHGQKMG